MDVPLAGVRANHPITTLRVLHHQLLERGIELLLRDAAGNQLSFEQKELIFGFTKLIGRHDFSPLKITTDGTENKFDLLRALYARR